MYIITSTTHQGVKYFIRQTKGVLSNVIAHEGLISNATTYITKRQAEVVMKSIEMKTRNILEVIEIESKIKQSTN